LPRLWKCGPGILVTSVRQLRALVFNDEVLRELYGPDYADQAETLRELEYVIRARTGHDVRCSALRGGFGCDCYKLTAAHAEHAVEIWARR
jgi:hypothetical protein